MTPAQEQDLNDLRLAAQQRDQAQLQFILKRLLRGMEFFVALSVPIERAAEYIDIFESYYPGETWVRQLLLAINAFGTKPDDTIAEAALSQQFTAPGAGNYLKAVYDITQAMNHNHTIDARIGFLASSVVNEIMAELVEAYYGEREGDWQRVRANQFDPATGAAEIAYQFWTAPETAALDTGCWLDVAASIEKKLQRTRA